LPYPTGPFTLRILLSWLRFAGHALDFPGDVELRRVAVGKMEGHSNEEIAGQIGRSPTTVERKLRLIQSIWEKEITP